MMKKRTKEKLQETTNLRVITIRGGSAICEMENGRKVKVNFQNIPYEVKIGDYLQAIIHYTKDQEIESILVV